MTGQIKRMQLNDFQKRLEKVKLKNQEFTFKLNDGVNLSDIAYLEQQIGTELPKAIRIFWTYSDGLETENPSFNICRIKDFNFIGNSLIHFATFDKDIKVYFDASKLNIAKEWSIVNFDENYTLTLTMASFWSNKIWYWLDSKTEIWKDGYWIK